VRKLRFVFDLDGTLCDTESTDYERAVPKTRRIRHVNNLYRAGHYIIIDTARGTETGQHHRALTEAQLKTWACPYHELHVGRKPYGHIYVDDHAIGADHFFALDDED